MFTIDKQEERMNVNISHFRDDIGKYPIPVVAFLPVIASIPCIDHRLIIHSVFARLPFFLSLLFLFSLPRPEPQVSPVTSGTRLSLHHCCRLSWFEIIK